MSTYYDGPLYVSETLINQDVPNNRSYVRFTVTLQSTPYGVDRITTHFDGDTINHTREWTGGTFTIRDEYRWLYHDGSGNRSLSVGATAHKDYDHTDAAVYSANFSVDLPHISRTVNFVGGSPLAEYVTATTFNVALWADAICDQMQLSIDGANWDHVQTGDLQTITVNAGTFTPGSTHTFAAAIKRKNSQLWTISGTKSVTMLPQAIITNNYGDFNDEFANPWVDFSNPGGLVTDVWFDMQSVGIASLAMRTGVSSRYTWTLTTAEQNTIRAAMANTNGAVIRYIASSWANGIKYDYVWNRVMSIVNANPTFSNFTYLDTNIATTNITGNNQHIIQGYSTLQVVISSADKAVALKYATMNKYTFNVAGISVEQAYSTGDINKDIGVISLGSNQSLAVTAVDSRSNSSTAVVKAVTIVPYAPPVVIASATRLNNFEADTTLVVSGTFSRLTVNGTDKNTITSSNVKYRYRQDGGAWGDWSTMTRTLGTGTFATTDAYLTLANASTFDIEVSATDSLATTVSTITVGRGIPLLMVSNNKHAIGINKMPDGDTPGLYLTTTDNLWLQIYRIGRVIFTEESANPSTYYGGTWIAYGQGKVPVGHAGSGTFAAAAGTTGGEETHTLTAAEQASMPLRSADAMRMNAGGSMGGYIFTPSSVNNGASEMNAVGGGGSHNNLQPYIVVYMWKRTA